MDPYDVTDPQALHLTIHTLQDMLERMNTDHVSWTSPTGEDVHPDWCQRCREEAMLSLLTEWFEWWRNDDATPAKLPKALLVRTAMWLEVPEARGVAGAELARCLRWRGRRPVSAWR